MNSRAAVGQYYMARTSQNSVQQITSNTLVHRHRLEEKAVYLAGLMDACPVTTPKLQLPAAYDHLVHTSPRIFIKIQMFR